MRAAAALFNDKGSAKSDRHKLVVAINAMIVETNIVEVAGSTLFDTIYKNQADARLKEKIEACAVALKLAMNLFELAEPDPKEQGADHGDLEEGQP